MYEFAVNKAKLDRAIKNASVDINGKPVTPTEENVKALYVAYGGLCLEEGVDELKERARYNKFNQNAADKLEAKLEQTNEKRSKKTKEAGN